MADLSDDRDFYERDRDNWRDKARATQELLGNANQRVSELECTSDALTREVRSLKAELAKEVERNKELEDVNRRSRELEVNGEEAWRWGGDGEDHLGSMGNDMAVLIRAGDLRMLLKEEVVKQAARRFPIQRGASIPWSMIAPHERQCQRNHSQSLERLSQRGGLSPWEALLVLDDLPLSAIWEVPKEKADQVAREKHDELERRREEYEGPRKELEELRKRIPELERRADVLSHQAVDRLDNMRAQLDAVMHSVDKWFNDDDPRLKDNPATRAAVARELALRAIESESRKLAIVEKAGEGLMAILDRVKLFADDIPDGLDPTMYYTGSAHGDRLMKVSYMAHREAIAGDTDDAIKKAADAIQNSDASADGPCPHARASWRMCPHCLGINQPHEDMPVMTSSTEGPVSDEFGETIRIADMKTDHRPMLGGWAPGNYVNKPCMHCGEKFIGDKRAVSCADCAYGGREVTIDEAQWMDNHVGELLKVPGNVDLSNLSTIVYEGRGFKVIGADLAPKHSSTFSVLKVVEVGEDRVVKSKEGPSDG